MKVKADLHNHLRTSSIFSDGDFNRAVDIASKRLGSGGVLGMVNFYDKRYEDFVGLRGYDRYHTGKSANGIHIPSKNLVIVKGQEVPTKEGHVLVFGLGYDVHLKNYRHLEDTLKEARDNNRIVIADHPFYRGGIGNYLENHQDLLQHFDAIEVHNGEAAFSLPIGNFPEKANERAAIFYNKVFLDHPNLGALSSSDGHSMYEIGSSWTEIDSPEITDKTKFVHSLRNAIRNASFYTERKNTNSVFGAIDHIADLVFITKIAPKIGLAKRFDTERPDN